MEPAPKFGRITDCLTQSLNWKGFVQPDYNLFGHHKLTFQLFSVISLRKKVSKQSEKIDILHSLYYDLIKICDITFVLVSDSFFSSLFFPLLSNSRVNKLTPASRIFSSRAADPLNYKLIALQTRNLLLLESLRRKWLASAWVVPYKTNK